VVEKIDVKDLPKANLFKISGYSGTRVNEGNRIAVACPKRESGFCFLKG
jgi:hypothetical protein